MTASIDVSTPDRPVIVITRDFDAPRDLVWKVITDPKHVAVWYGGPGFTNPVCEMDLRPGGTWHHVMQAPDGTRYTINSVFEEIVEPERLIWRTIKDPDRNPPPPTSLNTVTLEIRGQQTRWKLVSLFDSMIDRDLTAKMGFGQMIGLGTDRIAAHLTSLQGVKSRG
ncbi:MAG TPA: SRPBCC domain-containing protein [Steroidobacteraceae bacterium]|nr:SRPBCC domain-containing protein [Steroidobacteraceae bacterium]